MSVDRRDSDSKEKSLNALQKSLLNGMCTSVKHQPVSVLQSVLSHQHCHDYFHSGYKFSMLVAFKFTNIEIT